MQLVLMENGVGHPAALIVDQGRESPRAKDRAESKAGTKTENTTCGDRPSFHPDRKKQLGGQNDAPDIAENSGKSGAILILLMSIFGAKIAVLYVVLGLVIAVVGGTLLEKMGMERYVEDFIKNAPHIEAEGQELTRHDRVQFAKEQLLGTIKKVAPYIFVGVGIGAFIHNVVPQEWVETILGSNNPFAVVLATLVGVPMYADIFGTIPVAESLLYKGAGLGTILSFMMAVTTLSLPSLVMLKKAVKPKLLAAFIAICTVGIIIVGYFFNAIQFMLI